MSEILKKFEIQVIKLLTEKVLSLAQIKDIELRGKFVGYEYTGSGYFLKISHPNLPDKRIVCHKPIVMGEADNIVCGFVIFIENCELVIECHSWGEINVPEEFRNKNVQVKVSKNLLDLTQI